VKVCNVMIVMKALFGVVTSRQVVSVLCALAGVLAIALSNH
jgi:hypothetical protein